MFKTIFFFKFCLFYAHIVMINTNDIGDKKLLFVQMLWRHGDRTPVELYPTDPNPASVWKEGLGQLTLLGRKQHYTLGKFFRGYYENFITTNPREINVISSDCDRCMDSAQANLASFYTPTADWQFENDVTWQPIPIRYLPKDKDKYLETESYCPEASKEQQRIIDSKEGQEFIKENWAMFQYLSNHSGNSITYWQTANYLFDVLKIEKKYGFTLPSWTNTYWNQLSNVSALSFYWSFNSPLLHKLRAGPLIGAIKQSMLKKISNMQSLEKIQIFSAHDTTIAVFLQALNLYNMRPPPYCSTVSVELYGHNDTYYVRLLYFNSTTPESGEQTPYILTIKGCDEFCPLDYFVNYTKDLIPSDWEADCNIKSGIFDIDEKSVIAGVMFTILALLIIGFSSYALWRLHSRNRNEYSYQFLNPNINS